MGELKTIKNDGSVEEFIGSIENETRQKDSFELLEIFSTVTGEKAKMWGGAIVGFGEYHYKSERSNQEGDWPLVAFSPRKQNLTLYVIGHGDIDGLLMKLGKHKTSVSCLYINTLADVDMAILEEIIRRSFVAAKKQLVP